MRNNWFYLWFIFLCPSIGYSQYNITGHIANTKNHPVAFANVILTDSTQAIIKGAISSGVGEFHLDDIPKGYYTLKINYLGYAPWQKEIVLSTDKTIDTIHLKSNPKALKAVVLETEKPVIEQRVDRLIFNIDNTIIGTSGSASSALKSTPGVTYQNGKISIIGKTAARIMINGRLVKLSADNIKAYLNSIPAQAIQRIEVISTPPAKYAAEGNGGLINIVLKEKETNRWSNTITGRYTQTTYPTFHLGNRLLYSKGKFSASLALSGEKGNRAKIINSVIQYPEGPWKTTMNGQEQQDNFTGNLHLDYQLNKNSALGLRYHTYYQNDDLTNHDLTRIFSTTQTYRGHLRTTGFSDNTGKFHNLGAYYQQQLDTLGWNFNLSLDYLNYHRLQNRHFTTRNAFAQQPSQYYFNGNDQTIENYSVSLNFTQPLSWGTLTYGGKWLRTTTDNRLQLTPLKHTTTQPDALPAQYDHFNYTENISAFYADISTPLGEKWLLKAGLRLENTQAKGRSLQAENAFDRQKLSFFPSVYLTYHPTKKNVFNLSYSRRISRPDFNDLNPFKWYLSTQSYTQGNPFLQASIADNIALKYSYRNTLISKVFVMVKNDGFGQVPYVNPASNQQHYLRQNFYNTNTYGLSETLVFNPFKWWHSITQAVVFYLDGSFKPDLKLPTPITGVNAQLYTHHSFQLDSDHRFSLETTFRYRFPSHKLIVKASKAWSLNLGVQGSFLDQKLHLSLMAEDIFKTSDFWLTSYTNTIVQHYHTYRDSRLIRLSISYRLGDKITPKKHQNANQDIIDRAS